MRRALLLVLALASVAHAQDATPALPSGHPTVGGHEAAPSPFFRPPPDTSDEVATLPPGSIRVELRDARNEVAANHPIELGMIQQSVAKGESRKHQSATTDAQGVAIFRGLETGSGMAYRVSAHEGAASFGARPFQLGPDHGMLVVLHVYPPTNDYANQTIIITRGIIHVEVKDDRIQLQQRLDFFNGSPVAWIPKDMILRLPADFTALSNAQQMSDVAVDAVDKQGAKLRGTFGPGENSVIFSWQLPYSGQSDVQIEIGMPPNLGSMMVRAAAAPNMRLEVDRFPAAVAQTNEEGTRELVTAKQVQQTDGPLEKIQISIHDLPTPGPTRLVATALASLAVAAGLWVGLGRTQPRRTSRLTRRDRTRILAELEQLERDHATGDIGPKTYERARRELIDELALVLSEKTTG